MDEAVDSSPNSPVKNPYIFEGIILIIKKCKEKTSKIKYESSKTEETNLKFSKNYNRKAWGTSNIVLKLLIKNNSMISWCIL